MKRFDFQGKRGVKIFDRASNFGRVGLANINKARGLLTQAQNFTNSDQGKALHTLLAAGDQLSGNRANLTGRVDKMYRGVNTAGRFADNISGAVDTAKRDMQGGLVATVAALSTIAMLIIQLMKAKREMQGSGPSSSDFSKLASQALAMAKQQGIKGLPDKLSKSDIKKVYDISKDIMQQNAGSQLLRQNSGKVQDFANSIGLGKQVGVGLDMARDMTGGLNVRQLYRDVSKIAGPKLDIRNIYDDVQAKARQYVPVATGRAMNFANQNRGLVDDFSRKLGLSNQTNAAYNFGRSMVGGTPLPRLPAHDGLSYMRSVHSLYA